MRILRRLAKSILFQPIADRLVVLLDNAVMRGWYRHRWAGIDQLILMNQYRALAAANGPPLSFRDVGFRLHSQNEEDGILLYIFALLGTTNRHCIEICASDGIQCNTANLILNHKWHGLLCDGSESHTRKARAFYKDHPDTRYWPPIIVHSWVTAENVNEIITKNGFCGEIDLLSIDLDGNDYWIWKAIECVSPRVVVVEYNHLWGPDASVTVPYADDFQAEFTQYGSDYGGASLNAFVKLGLAKGYRLVGSNAYGFNAFFVRSDLKCSWLPQVHPTTCFDHPRARFGMEHRFPRIKDKPWVQV